MKFLIGIKDETKRLWYSIIYIIVNIFAVFGLLCPFLISYNDDFLVILGVALVIANASHLLFFVIKLVKSFNLIKNEKNS